MSELKPLFLQEKEEKTSRFNRDRGSLVKKQQKNWKRLFRKFRWIILIIILFLGLNFWAKSQNSTVFHYVLGQQNSLKIVDGKVNVLLLGIAGGDHDGPNLTDTIMVASYDVKTHNANLISLPRDLWIDKTSAKVNALYQVGLNKGNGLDFTKKEIGDVLGLEIPYAVRLDFSGFTKAVDLVGGVDVDVARSFDDYAYPIPGKEDELCGFKETEKDIDADQAKSLNIEPGKIKVLLDPEGKIATAAAKSQVGIDYTDNQVLQYFSCRYEHLTFKAGQTHMDGTVALKFVRSRHAVGPEGSDFSRSKRQQLVLQSFKSKVLSLDTLANLQKIIGLIKTIGSSIDTNIPQSDYLEFAKLIKENSVVKSYVIDESGENPLLINPPSSQYGGGWVLIPPKNDFTAIHQYVLDILSGVLEASESAKPSISPK